MSTETAAVATAEPDKDDFVITITKTTVETLRERAAAIKLAGVVIIDGKAIVQDAAAMLADKTGLKLVKEMRSAARTARTTCEKEHKRRKEDALRECQRIDKSRRDMVALIESIELPLVKLEDAVEAELDRIAKEKADAIYNARLKVLMGSGAEEVHVDEAMIRRMDDDAFQKYVEHIAAERKRKIEAEAERLRLLEEARIEAAKVEAERVRVAELQRIENEKIAAKLKELEDRQAEADRLQKIEQAKLEEERQALARQRVMQAEEAENARIAEQNRIAAEQLKIDEAKRQQEELAKQLELQAQSLASQALALEHEQEHAPRREQQLREIEQARELLAPYEAIQPLPKTLVKAWHRDAAMEIWQRYVTDGQHPEPPVDEIAMIICEHDPFAGA